MCIISLSLNCQVLLPLFRRWGIRGRAYPLWLTAHLLVHALYVRAHALGACAPRACQVEGAGWAFTHRGSVPSLRARRVSPCGGQAGLEAGPEAGPLLLSRPGRRQAARPVFKAGSKPGFCVNYLDQNVVSWFHFFCTLFIVKSARNTCTWSEDRKVHTHVNAIRVEG